MIKEKTLCPFVFTLGKRSGTWGTRSVGMTQDDTLLLQYTYLVYHRNQHRKHLRPRGMISLR
jgi:hypothetical protein